MLIELAANELGLRVSYLQRLARTASHQYMTYPIPKARGGFRNICHPSRELKAVQRWLLVRVISGLPVHKAAAAYYRGATITEHAQRHLRSAYLLRLDLANFFESLSAEDVAKHLARYVALLPPGWSDPDTDAFCSWVCRFERLTIGAVSSPSLSNTLCFSLDEAIARFCGEQAVIYSRYADDMYFSSVAPNVLKDIEPFVGATLRDLAYPTGLILNDQKRLHSSKKGQRRVTGIVLPSSGGISLGRPLKRRIRGLVHRWTELTAAERKSLAGLLAYAQSVEPDLINRLILKFGPDVVARAQSRQGEAS